MSFLRRVIPRLPRGDRGSDDSDEDGENEALLMREDYSSSESENGSAEDGENEGEDIMENGEDSESAASEVLYTMAACFSNNCAR